jgi:hypothetical protein
MNLRILFSTYLHSFKAFLKHAELAAYEKEWIALQNARDALTVQVIAAKARWEKAHAELPEMIVGGKVIGPQPITNTVM